jgi:hypothetical protein
MCSTGIRGPADIDEISADDSDLSWPQAANPAVDVLGRRDQMHLRAVRDQRCGVQRKRRGVRAASSRRNAPSARTRADTTIRVSDSVPSRPQDRRGASVARRLDAIELAPAATGAVMS